MIALAFSALFVGMILGAIAAAVIFDKYDFDNTAR